MLLWILYIIMKNKSNLTQDKLTAHAAKAMLVTCMDFRFRNDAMNYMKEHGYDVNYDQFILAGVTFKKLLIFMKK